MGAGAATAPVRCACLPASAPAASAATSAAVPPPAAVTTAATNPSTSGAGLSTHAVAHLVVEQIQGQLRAQHGAAQVEQHDDTVFGVDPLDRLLHLDGVGAERGLVEPGGDRDRGLDAMEHLTGELGRGASEGSAVRDDDDSNHDVSRGLWPQRCTSSAADVAPGSWCPMLRSPR